MELIKPFWSIYNMYDTVKSNGKQFPHVMERLKALEKLVVFILQKQPDQLSDDVNEAFGKLNKILLSATELIGKFTEAHKVTQVVKSSDYKLEVESLNKSLTDAFVMLSGALHVHEGKTLHEQEIKLAEQEEKLQEQERKLAEQERKLAEQEELLQRVESMLANESRAYYCILQ